MKTGGSLTRLIIMQVLAISLLLTGVRYVVVNAEVSALLSDVGHNILNSRLWEVASYLRRDGSGRLTLNVPEIRAKVYAEPGIDYIVRDKDMKMLFHSDEPWVNYTPPKIPAPGEFEDFEFAGPGGDPYVGQVGWVNFSDAPYLVQVTLSRRLAAQFPEKLNHDFFYKYGMMSALFFGLLSLTIAVSIRRSMRPVNAASQRARAISFSTPGVRLAAEGLPGEIRPLVEAFNLVLERLETGIRAQKDFTAHVAHELRTPLSLLQAQVGLLEPGDLRERLSGDIKAMTRLIEQLLAAARLEYAEALAARSVDLAALVREACLAVWPLALARQLKLEVSGAEEPATIDGHADSILRALLNVLENAVRHAPAGSAIDVELKGTAVRVRDHGPGVADVDKPHIFQMFWRGRGRERGSGAGLGLHIVRATMKLHGGTVRIEDAPGGGAVFILEFPAPQTA